MVIRAVLSIDLGFQQQLGEGQEGRDCGGGAHWGLQDTVLLLSYLPGGWRLNAAQSLSSPPEKLSRSGLEWVKIYCYLLLLIL